MKDRQAQPRDNRRSRGSVEAVHPVDMHLTTLGQVRESETFGISNDSPSPSSPLPIKKFENYTQLCQIRGEDSRISKVQREPRDPSAVKAHGMQWIYKDRAGIWTVVEALG